MERGRQEQEERGESGRKMKEKKREREKEKVKRWGKCGKGLQVVQPVWLRARLLQCYLMFLLKDRLPVQLEVTAYSLLSEPVTSLLNTRNQAFRSLSDWYSVLQMPCGCNCQCLWSVLLGKLSNCRNGTVHFCHIGWIRDIVNLKHLKRKRKEKYRNVSWLAQFNSVY